MPRITEPVPRPLQRCLRSGVLALATSERRLRFPATVLVGVPGRADVRYAAGPEALDHDLRTEVVVALLDRWLATTAGDPPPLLWLHRPGDLQPVPPDLAWLAAATAAYAGHELPLTMVVMTRHGWLDPRTGTSRRWVRLRPHSG